MERESRDKINKIMNIIAASVLDIAKTIIIVFAVNILFISLCKVNGKSMEPTLSSGEFIVIQRLFKDYDRGDIVVTNTNNSFKESLIKRVIAIEGDSVIIDNDGTIYVNGKKIAEQLGNKTTGDIKYPYKVPKDCLFLVGDNRNESTDSRFKIVGVLNKVDILGEMIFKV